MNLYRRGHEPDCEGWHYCHCPEFVPVLSECPSCKGSKVRGLRVDFERTDGRVFDGEDPNQPCPDCGGRGVRIPDEWVEAVARTLVQRLMGVDASWPRPDDGSTEVYRNDVRNILAAVLDCIEREET